MLVSIIFWLCWLYLRCHFPDFSRPEEKNLTPDPLKATGASLKLMPSRCAAPRCVNNSNNGYCFKTFPKDETLRQKWLSAVGETWQPPKSASLCEVHFDPSFITFNRKRKSIEVSAVPTLFCNCLAESRGDCHMHEYSKKVKTTESCWDHEYAHNVNPKPSSLSHFPRDMDRKRIHYRHLEGCVTLKLPLSCTPATEASTCEPDQFDAVVREPPKCTEISPKDEVAKLRATFEQLANENFHLKFRSMQLENQLSNSLKLLEHIKKCNF